MEGDELEGPNRWYYSYYLRCKRYVKSKPQHYTIVYMDVFKGYHASSNSEILLNIDATICQAYLQLLWISINH